MGAAALMLACVYLGLAAPSSTALHTLEAPPHWARVDPADPAVPPPREQAAIAYDPDHNEVVLFGGTGADPLAPALDDTWTWNGQTWTPRTPPGGESPPPLIGAAMAFDGERVVLFGGSEAGGALNPDTWFWENYTWTRLATTPAPPARSGATMAFHERLKVVVLFGGSDRTTTHGDTWLWDGPTRSWTPLGPSAEVPPRRNAAMAYDEARGNLVLFGGFGGDPAGHRNDTWLWNDGVWRQGPGAPPGLTPREWAAMAFDGITGRLVMYGGSHQETTHSLPTPDPAVQENRREGNETWTWDGTGWRREALSPGEDAGYRAGASMASNANLGPPGAPRAVMLFGGREKVHQVDTWVWDGTAVPPSTTTSTTTPTSTSTTTTTAPAPPGPRGNGGDAAPDAAVVGDGGGGGFTPAGGNPGGGTEGTATDPGSGLLDGGEFESAFGADGDYGLTEFGAGAAELDAFALGGLAAAPPPPVVAGAPTPPPPAVAQQGFLPTNGPPNAAPVGGAAPGAGRVPGAATRYLMVAADDPAAGVALGGAGLMFLAFCFQVVRGRPVAAPAPAWSGRPGRAAPRRA